MAAEESDPTSTLTQYRSMLHLRHELAALASDDLNVPDRDDDVLVIERGDNFACVVNCSDHEVVSPVAGHVLLASAADVMEEGDRITLPPSAGVWISR